MSNLRVVIADDHPMFREGIAAILGTVDDIDVVALADDGAAAVAAVEVHAPDVVLMDLRMPEMSGVEATQRIKRDAPATSVLMLTMNEDDESLLAALRAGALGYLLKEAVSDDIVRGIRAVARGEAVFGAGVAPRVLSLLATGTRTKAFPALSDREHEILELMAAGKTNQQIASALFISDKTVRNNVSAVLNKIGATTRAEAVAKARDAGVGA